MKQQLKKGARSRNDFVCWCPEEKAFESLFELRKHQETTCSITIRKKLNELYKSIKKTKVEHRAQHEADLREWKKEKARGNPEM